MEKINFIVYVCLLHFLQVPRGQCEGRISKRSLFFPFTTILQFNYGLSVPITIDGAPGGTTIVLSVVLQGNYDLPKMESDIRVHNLTKRDLGKSDISKFEFYKYFTEYLESSQLNGEKCLLRMICEIAKYPLDKDNADNVIEKIAHFLFTPSVRSGAEEEDQQNSYFKMLLEAEESGKRGEHCKTKYNMCELSLASIFSKFFIK